MNVKISTQSISNVPCKNSDNQIHNSEIGTF